jgi:hypothetical protein
MKRKVLKDLGQKKGIALDRFLISGLGIFIFRPSQLDLISKSLGSNQTVQFRALLFFLCNRNLKLLTRRSGDV